MTIDTCGRNLFFTNMFYTGMTSTQRSESTNHLLKTYIPPSAPVHLFVSQYNQMITDRVPDEGKEEHATKQVCRLKLVRLNALQLSALTGAFLAGIKILEGR